MKKRMEIIGTNQTTPGNATAPSTLTTDTTTTTGLTIKFLDDDIEQVGFQCCLADGTPILEFTQECLRVIDATLGVADGVFSSRVRLNSIENPPCLEWADGGSSQGAKWWFGHGAPTDTSPNRVGNAAVGDLYFRGDTPSTPNQRLYVCTVAGAGSAGTWSGIA